ncbi:VOC family protein [Halorientalis marina]|jgi:catechol 2,3-dioxygenase-like lactoylglutathione lyase family enzyme|uniref:VOC family protein n=1 Tax=Halorientalis marina TaxID=2931976 RepID=UPI001FF1E133|nr:VOC family protein [Halorientalis marina]
MDPESFFHVAIKTDDLDASEGFYQDHFDASVVERGSADGSGSATDVNHVTLDIGDKLLYLFDEAPYEAAGLVESVPTGFLHFGYVVPDVDAAVTDLDAANVPVFMPPTTFGDLRIAFLTDPNGARVELIEHL